MYIKDGIAYAGNSVESIEIEEVKSLDGMMLLLTFNTNEKRLYDASALLEYPAFKRLEKDEAFKTAKVEHGVVTWLDGEIDIAPEALYRDSFVYQEAVV